MIFSIIGIHSETKKRSLPSLFTLLSIGIVPPIFVDSLLNETNPSPLARCRVKFRVTLIVILHFSRGTRREIALITDLSSNLDECR